jgi:hypothetical protein
MRLHLNLLPRTDRPVSYSVQAAGSSLPTDARQNACCASLQPAHWLTSIMVSVLNRSSGTQEVHAHSV